VEALDLGVHLQPVAGRDHGRLRHRRAGLGVGDQLGDAVGVERDPLQQRDRGGVVGDADKVEPAADGGSVVKVESTYKLLPGVDEKDEEAKAKEALTAIFKGAEAYLVANPDAYN
jgi:hypothetical protein